MAGRRATALGLRLAWCCSAVAAVVGLAGCPTDPPLGPAVVPPDYQDTYTEVRNCRQSGDHDLNMVRVLADPAALVAYRDRAAPFPEGAIVIKEEFEFGDATCAGSIKQITVMERVAVGSAPSLLDWHWQQLDPDLNVLSDNASRCPACHQMCGVAPDGYDGTCTVP